MQEAQRFKGYAIAFEKKLEFVEIDDITTDLYLRNYLSHLLQHKKYYLAIYADVLHRVIKHSSKNKERIFLLDYGAGNGLLGIFAKFCGFKKVIINDIAEECVHASQKLAIQLDIELDDYLTGDITTVQEYFEDEAPDAIVGTDVIEHIYDLEHFFSTLQRINPSLVSVFTTGSNPENYLRVRTLRKMQLKDELKGGTPDDYLLFGGRPEAFIKIREEIIRRHVNSLPETSIIALTKATRGKNERDIVAAVVNYNSSGEIPFPPADKTNTCDPLTGSWTERILSLKEYSLLYNSAGFKAKFYNGFYNDYETGFKNHFKRVLNILIGVLGNKISPYIVIVGTPPKPCNGISIT